MLCGNYDLFLDQFHARTPITSWSTNHPYKSVGAYALCMPSIQSRIPRLITPWLHLLTPAGPISRDATVLSYPAIGITGLVRDGVHGMKIVRDANSEGLYYSPHAE